MFIWFFFELRPVASVVRAPDSGEAEGRDVKEGAVDSAVTVSSWLGLERNRNPNPFPPLPPPPASDFSESLLNYSSYTGTPP